MEGGIYMVLHPKPNERYTYKDYLQWADDERWELINGIPYKMTPAPSPDHQRILRELLTEFNVYLRGKTCEVYPAPFDVRLFPNEKEDDDNIVQPDLTVVCDPNKVNKKGCEGRPDLVIEILSPSTAKKDRSEKKKLYERAMINEYWIVDPLNQTIEVFLLSDIDQYSEPEIFGVEDKIKVSIFDELIIPLNTIFK